MYVSDFPGGIADKNPPANTGDMGNEIAHSHDGAQHGWPLKTLKIELPRDLVISLMNLTAERIRDLKRHTHPMFSAPWLMLA